MWILNKVSIKDNGTLQGTPPDVTYTPNDHYVGNDSFLFQSNDGNSLSRQAIVKINTPFL